MSPKIVFILRTFNVAPNEGVGVTFSFTDTFLF